MNNKVMVVDDEEPVRFVMNEVFKLANFDVRLAESSEEALEILKREEDIHVFFLDLNMPGMNGAELCGQIRIGRPLDFICAITGYGTVFSIAECLKAGFNDYFTKPFDNNQLLDVTRAAFVKLKRWQSYCNDWALSSFK